jgi:hypothetical protein
MLGQLYIWSFWIQHFVMLISPIVAWRWGKGPELQCAIILALMVLCDWLYHLVTGNTAILNEIDPGHLFIDTSAGLAFFVVSLRANRLYPICISALQLVSITSHFARGIDERIARLIYGAMIIGPSYFQIALLYLGIILHHRRQQKYGDYPQWLNSSDRLRENAQNVSRRN